MPCPHCKADIAPADVYCFSCGARLPPPSASSAVAASAAVGTVDGAGRPAAANADSTTSWSSEELRGTGVQGGRHLAFLLLTLLINLCLLAGSAWLVYAALQRNARRRSPELNLGVPRVLRTVARPAADAAVQTVPSRRLSRPSATAAALRPATPHSGVSSNTARPGEADRPADPPPPQASGGSRSGLHADGGGAAQKPDRGTASSAEEVAASLDAGSVRMVVQHHLPQVRACYERAVKQLESLAGLVEIEFEVSAEGQVRSASVHRNTTGHQGLGLCIAGLLKTWHFPRPVGGDVVFIYPFLFAAGE